METKNKILKKITRKDIIAKLKLYKKKNQLHEKMLNSDLSRLSEKGIIELDKKTDKLNKVISKYYVTIRDYLVNEKGVNKIRAHNFIMNYK